jgi:hypothetical protein
LGRASAGQLAIGEYLLLLTSRNGICATDPSELDAEDNAHFERLHFMCLRVCIFRSSSRQRQREREREAIVKTSRIWKRGGKSDLHD